MASCMYLRAPISHLLSGMHLIFSSRVQPYLWHRTLSQSSVLHIKSLETSAGEKVSIHFVNQDGVKITTQVTEGESLLDVVINKNLDINGFGACEGTLACSTCHLIFDENIYKKLEPVVDEEMDMLDLAYGQAKTSRLGCQVRVQRWMNGMTVHVPRDIKDMRGVKESAGEQ